jgi:hypothetical protein
MRRGIGALIGLVVCCAATALLGAEKGARAVKSIYYANADHTFYERFVEDETNALWWEGGNTAQSRSTAQSQKNASFEDFTSAPLHDCSDEKYRCLYGLYRVFAVPRMGLGSQSTYNAGGAVFRVEKCIRSAKDRCVQALMSSDCQSKAEPDRCTEVVGGRSKSTAPGPIVYFVFEEKTGVAAYGDGKPVVGEEAQLAAAKDLRLRGGKGLLGGSSFPPRWGMFLPL